MTETKQDVFNAAVEKAVGMTLVAGYTSYGDKCFKDMQKRYAAASDGETDCPYCHGLRNLMSTGDGVLSIDGETLEEQQMWDYYHDEPSDNVRAVPINYCPICGRRLGETK